MGLKTTWKGTLRCGLVTFPVALATGSNDPKSDVKFHSLHSDECKTQLEQDMSCPTCKVVVPNAEIVKGYDLGDGQWLTFTAEELESCEPVKTKLINIVSVSPRHAVDVRHFDSYYYIGTEPAGVESLALMREAIGSDFAIGTIVMNGRNRRVAIGSMGKALVMYCLRAANEIRDIGALTGYDSVPTVVNPALLQLAKQLLKTMWEETVDLSAHLDEVRENRIALIEAKKNGTPLELAAPVEVKPSMDLMAQLRASLSDIATIKEDRKLSLVPPTPLPVNAKAVKADTKAKGKSKKAAA